MKKLAIKNKIKIITVSSLLVTLLAGCDQISSIVNTQDSTQSPDIAPSPTATSNILDNYEYITKSNNDIHKGFLILVNKDAEYIFPTISNLISIYEAKNTSYKVRDRNVEINKDVMDPLNKMMKDFCDATTKTDVLIASGYRSKEYQENLFNNEVASKGEEEALKWVALPGRSEHHTGLSVDLSIYTDEGLTYEFTGSDEYKWINDNSYKYGFINRYPADKTTLTNTAAEPWHFRYTGIPHAYYMTQNNLCLEEYIQLLKDYEAGSKHLEITDYDNKKYEVYYVKASDTEETQIPVPSSHNYSISGNNIDGFIITFEIS